MVHASTAPTTESPSGASTERTSDDPMLALYRQHGLPEARPVKPKETKKTKKTKEDVLLAKIQRRKARLEKERQQKEKAILAKLEKGHTQKGAT